MAARTSAGGAAHACECTEGLYDPTLCPACLSVPVHAAQALLVLVKRQPPDGRKLLVIGTSSRSEHAGTAHRGSSLLQQTDGDRLLL